MRNELGTFLTISSAHLTPATRARLDGQPLRKWPCYGGPLPDGYFIYVHDENTGVADDEIPADLWACIEYARARGAHFVRFDHEVDHEEGLPVWRASDRVGITRDDSCPYDRGYWLRYDGFPEPEDDKEREGWTACDAELRSGDAAPPREGTDEGWRAALTLERLLGGPVPDGE